MVEVAKFSPFKPGFVAKNNSPFLHLLPEASMAPKGKFRLVRINRKKFSSQILEFKIIDDFDTSSEAARAMPTIPKLSEEYGVYDDQGNRKTWLAA